MLLLTALPTVLGCSFLVTRGVTFDEQQLRYANELNRLRGPDLTTYRELGGTHIIHNLLWLTGTPTPQPFMDANAQVAALFNGEIYNYQELGSRNYSTDGAVLLPMYAAHGELFPRALKGEFAVVVADMARDLLLLSTDVFGTKPFWLGVRSGKTTAPDGAWGVASYESALHRLGLTDTIKLAPNTIEVRRLNSGVLLRTHQLHTFDLAQHKRSLDDWNHAFREAVRRRLPQHHSLFIGLSSGSDSGVIGLRLAELNHPHHVYSLDGIENASVILARHAFHRARAPNATTWPLLTLSREEFRATFTWSARNVEGLRFLRKSTGRLPMIMDTGAMGLSYICAQAKPRGVRVYMSGAGGDEIYTDYQRIRWWPKDLQNIFPWPAFFLEEMHDFLRKEELVAGAHGMEGRYPPLDVDLVQEWLWLHPKIKNSKPIKYPLYKYMAQASYPLKPKGAARTGFITHQWLRWGFDLFDTMGGRLRASRSKPKNYSSLSYPLNWANGLIGPEDVRRWHKMRPPRIAWHKYVSTK